MRQGDSLWDTARGMTQELWPKAKKGLEAFLKVIENGKALLETPLAETGEQGAAPTKKKKKRAPKDGEWLTAGEGLSVCVAQMLQESGIAEYHQDDEIAGNQRLTNMQELVNAASLYAGTITGLLEFLEHIELDRSLEDNAQTEDGGDDKVTLITFHNTKGLEFRRVIMTGLEQGVFPREDKKDEELEEERRLFYVGATRAMDELYVTSCAVRRMYGRTMQMYPSMFLGEVDKDRLRIIGNAPYSFGGRRPHPWDDGYVENDAERVSGWRKGQRLFHDDYGYGAVIKVDDSDDGPVVRVQFETGRETHFLSEHQGSAFVKIGDDD
jgi:DNA helicase-2/ATP-dependent DNA helicase PcrA